MTPPSQTPSQKPPRTARDLAARAGRAFTIMEMIVAVGAVALLSIAIAQIFRATGETVRIGKRVSNLSDAALMLERQMRKDIESMTPGGFMVIRNEITPFPVSLHRDAPADPPAQARRIDELVFFATGDFVSLRDPVHPYRVARSSEARIYYGHGQKWLPSDTRYVDPVHLDNANTDAALSPGLGFPQTTGTGPDKYASDWTLLRQVTLLIPPKQILLDPLPGPVGMLVEPGALERPDNEIQVYLQPAASHIFRYLLVNDPLTTPSTPAPTDATLVRDGPVEKPRFECGAIDIATTSLAEIRAIILDAQDFNTVTYPFDLNSDLGTLGNPGTLDNGTSGSVFLRDVDPAVNGSTTRRMHAWMRQAFPAPSDPQGSAAGKRIRCEPAPPNLLGSLAGARFDREYKRTDQEMLTAFNLAPHCTEFIVEWSFGCIYPQTHVRAGQVIWHGQNDARTPLTWAYRHPNDPATVIGASTYLQSYRTTDPASLSGIRTRGVPRYLISEPNGTGGGGGTSLREYAYFGYLDPTYTPGDRYDPENLPWAWPKLIRVTLSLVDPSDPVNEQTFQFIFKVPVRTANERVQY